jgi:hypothetical protein
MPGHLLGMLEPSVVLQVNRDAGCPSAIQGSSGFLSWPMKGPARRKCLCCKEFYRPDPRNLRHQRYCSKPPCRKESKAQTQRRCQQRPENQNYFRGPENSRRVKEWRERNPGYWRKSEASVQVPLQEDCQEQVAPNEEVSFRKTRSGKTTRLSQISLLQRKLPSLGR